MSCQPIFQFCVNYFEYKKTLTFLLETVHNIGTMTSYKIETTDLVEKVYSSIKEMILKRELIPGQKLIQEEMAKNLGVSRTPLLAAFSKLEKESLVESRPRRGFYIKELSMEDKLNLFDIRQRLEPLGARRAAENGSASEKKGLLELVENAPDFNGEDGFTLFNSHDFDFHEKIMSMSRNTMLKMMISSYNIISLSNQDESGINFNASLKDHLKIAKAIAEGNPDQAERTMELHIRTGQNRIREYER